MVCVKRPPSTVHSTELAQANGFLQKPISPAPFHPTSTAATSIKTARNAWEEQRTTICFANGVNPHKLASTLLHLTPCALIERVALANLLARKKRTVMVVSPRPTVVGAMINASKETRLNPDTLLASSTML